MDKICTKIIIRKRTDILVQNAAITPPRAKSRETIISQPPPKKKSMSKLDLIRNGSEVISAISRSHLSGLNFVSLKHHFSLIFSQQPNGANEMKNLRAEKIGMRHEAIPSEGRVQVHVALQVPLLN